ALTMSTTATFAFHSTESGSSFQCRLDGESFSPCSSPKGYSGLSDGSHTFQVRATDEAGNTDQTPAVFTWTVDTTPPDTLLDSGPPATTISTTAAFTFHSTESGGSFQCRLDGGGFAPCGSGQTYTGLALGQHVFAVKATDGAGNTAPTPASLTWTVLSPNSPPSITGLSLTPNPVNEGDTVTLNVAFTDPDAADTHTVTILWGDGSPGTIASLGAGV